MRLNLDSEIGLARFGVETKHETKPNLPNSADTMPHPSVASLCLCGCVLVAVDGCLWLPMPADMQMCKIYRMSKAARSAGIVRSAATCEITMHRREM